MPHVATSPTDLLETIRPAAHLDGDRLVIDDEAAFRARAIARPRLDRRLLRRTTPRSRPPAGSSGRRARRSAPAPRASRTSTRARARGEVSGFTVPAINIRAADLRHGPDGLRDGGQRGCRRRSSSSSPGASRPTRSSAPIEYATSVLAGAIAAGWRRPGLHPGRPLPVQRQEVRRRPRGDDRGDPRACRAGDRRRLPQHRHRQLDARRPVQAERRRAAARELHARRRADRAHPRRSSPTA